MFIKLFDVNEGVLVPTEHCLSLRSLKEIREAYPDNYLTIYLYLYYTTCLDPQNNPFFNTPEDEREDIVLQELKADFSVDDPLIIKGKELCEELYSTPTKRMYQGIKTAMDKISKFFETQSISTGRDGSLPAIVQAAAKFNELRESFKGVEKDYLEEVAQARGGQHTAYDQR